MMKEMKGVCLLFNETGTEGGWWAMFTKFAVFRVDARR